MEVFLSPPHRSELLTEQGNLLPLPTITDNDLSDNVFLRQVVGDASQYCSLVTALYCRSPPLATLRDIHHAETYRSALEYVIDQSVGNVFDTAILQCASVQLHEPDTQFNFTKVSKSKEDFQVRVVLAELMEEAGINHTKNMLAHNDLDEIFPPDSFDGTSAPENFPRTIYELRHLQEGCLLSEIEQFYGLTAEDDLICRIHNIRRVYGIIRFARAPQVVKTIK